MRRLSRVRWSLVGLRTSPRGRAGPNRLRAGASKPTAGRRSRGRPSPGVQRFTRSAPGPLYGARRWAGPGGAKAGGRGFRAEASTGPANDTVLVRPDPRARRGAPLGWHGRRPDLSRTERARGQGSARLAPASAVNRHRHSGTVATRGLGRDQECRLARRLGGT